MQQAQVVCVTGASGFLASCLVDRLLRHGGYHVRGLVRSLGDKQKIGHLENLDGAKDRLTLVEGNLLDYESLFSAFDGCDGVFHTACPVPSHTSTNPEVEVLDPAVNGTLNVLKACVTAKVKRVVMTSSVAAVTGDPNRPKENVVDESCWSNEEFLRENKHWYMLGKTLGEQAAWKFSKENNLDLVVILPSLILGPLLQSTVNSSSLVILNLLNGSSDCYENCIYGLVDVRDVAEAHILTYETPASSSQRYLCCNAVLDKSAIAGILRSLYPDHVLPQRCIPPGPPVLAFEKFSTKKLQDLGFCFTPLEQTLKDTVESLKSKGLLQ